MNHAKQKRRLKLAASVREIYGELDQHFATVPEREQITCRVGCAACCSMMIAMTLPEAIALVQRYPGEVERALPALEADLAEAIRIAAEVGLSPGVAVKLQESDRAEMCERWWLLQRRCPFLAPDNTCSVYEARPLACRTYHVRTDPSLCAAIPATRVEILTLSQDEEMQIMRAFQYFLTEAGIPGPFTCSALSEMVLYARKLLRE